MKQKALIMTWACAYIPIALVVSSFAMARTDLMPMETHMEIQGGATESDAKLANLPSVKIEKIMANVSLDDRFNADAVFNSPFPEALRTGLKWYLAKRGVRVVEADQDVQARITVVHYEGFDWGHDHGADVVLEVRLRQRSGQVVAPMTIHSLFKYSSEGSIMDEEKPKYKVRKLKASFPVVVFTRIGIDVGEKLISFLDETFGAPQIAK